MRFQCTWPKPCVPLNGTCVLSAMHSKRCAFWMGLIQNAGALMSWRLNVSPYKYWINADIFGWHSRSMLETTLVTSCLNVWPLGSIQNLPKINVSDVKYLLRFFRCLCSLWEHPMVDSSCGLFAHFTRFTTILSSLAQMSKNEGNSWMTQMIWCHPAPRWLNLDMVVIPWCSQGSYLSFAILYDSWSMKDRSSLDRSIEGACNATRIRPNCGNWWHYKLISVFVMYCSIWALPVSNPINTITDPNTIVFWLGRLFYLKSGHQTRFS